MDENKIAFISCVNNEKQYNEALYCISKLQVPPGFNVQCVAVRGAISMAAGYNTGMLETDAKYKVYMHQDVDIVCKDFIEKLLCIFNSDKDIGAIGMVGCTRATSQKSWWELPENIYGCVYQTDLLGKVKPHLEGRPWVNKVAGNGSPSGICKEVKLVDGLLIATAYDVPWRADIFHMFHFYDVSQSCEFIRRKMKVVVPGQREPDGTEQPWCMHVGDNGKVGKKFFEAKKGFEQEYRDILE